MLALVAACKPEIGDPCITSTDCSIRGDRICDLSHRVDGAGRIIPSGQGECIIEGCSRGNCPKEATCVKVYTTQYLSAACDPTREDVAVFGDTAGCIDGVCAPLDDCAPNEVCLPEGLCADEITARTSCRRKCDDSSDCRAGYSCRDTGSKGVYLAPDPDDPTLSDRGKICIPDG